VPFTQVFKGFEGVQAVRSVFGDGTEEVIGRLQIRLIPSRYMYMGVNDQDGNLAVGTHHLKHSDLRILYLDIVHELFHVGQFMRDKEWFGEEHQKYLKTGFDTSLYYESPIEVPAYKHAVDEARRIGMAHDEITEYLRIGPVDPKVFAVFLKAMDLRSDMATAPPAEIPVQIDRGVSVPVFPFTDYFVGFEEHPAARALFGDRTGEVLANLRVAFSPSAFGSISLNEEDGSLEVGAQYLEDGDERLIYMDVILCLNLLKRSSGRQTTADADPQSFAENKAVVESYRAAVAEARRIGTPDSKILSHLRVLNFIMAPGDFQRFTGRIGLRKKKRERSS
jgi:hypothetical protein